MRVVASETLSREYDRRYVVVDEQTGRIVDDAQGYGYKSAQNAHRAYSHKSASPKKRASRAAGRRKVERWCAVNGAFMADVELAMLCAVKDGAELAVSDVEEMLAARDLALPFSARDLMRYW